MEGYMENAQGHQVPLAQVQEIDKARHELVMEKVAKAKAMRKALAELKAEIMDDVGAFIQLSAEKYEVKVGGNKGNVSLLSFDGRYKIVRQVAENITFDERLQAAKALIDECLRDWTKDARSEIQAIIDQAFQVDKEGNLSTSRVLGLRRLNITDERWLRAMQAIGDSIQVTGTKPYVRVYERRDNGSYTAIPLDMAAV
ncbi:Protein of unknown function [Humidesulfovibrio mexicanus]|uniref:Sulfate transporter n=1 Tax=Humidesulfovibrio mexicanus TaxID=147047 RepID=A0A239BDX7_9BACT|nr:DUF3164 family protein [Humidesulfovibrio mexicanus]SNS06130.1 Protein of unknown function [Humidesulfovibrio mexicanus]